MLRQRPRIQKHMCLSIAYERKTGHILCSSRSDNYLNPDDLRSSIKSLGYRLEDIGVVHIKEDDEHFLKLRRFKKHHIENGQLVYTQFDYQTHKSSWGAVSESERTHYTYNDLLNMYNQHYIDYNFAKLVEMSAEMDSLIELKWMKISDIQLRDQLISRSWKKFNKDPFLNHYNGNKLALGVDIIENGGYWPFVTSSDYVIQTRKEEGTSIFSFEGNHRLPALLLAQAKGITPSKEHRILSIHYKHPEKGYYACKGRTDLKLPYKVWQRLPVDIALTSRFVSDELFRESTLRHISEEENIRLIDDQTVEVLVDNWSDLIECNQVYPHWLRDVIYYYRERGSVLQGHPVFNSIESYELWAKEHCPQYSAAGFLETLCEYDLGSYVLEDDNW